MQCTLYLIRLDRTIVHGKSPVIRLPTEIQILRRRRAKLHKNAQKSGRRRTRLCKKAQKWTTGGDMGHVWWLYFSSNTDLGSWINTCFTKIWFFSRGIYLGPTYSSQLLYKYIILFRNNFLSFSQWNIFSLMCMLILFFPIYFNKLKM